MPPLQSCGLQTGYDGDDACILPSTDGFQVHMGPSDHDDPDLVAPFLMLPGEEAETCFFLKTPNAAPIRVNAFQFRSRPGIVSGSVWLLAGSRPDSTGPESCSDLLNGDASLLLSVQRSQADINLGSAPENQGLSWRVPANAHIAFRTHYVNVTEAPTLREVWLNAVNSDATATQDLVSIELRGRGAPVPPGTTATSTFRCDAASDRRVVQLTAAMGPTTTRLSAYVVGSAGARTLVYSSYDWFDPGVLVYDSVTQNPAPDPGQAMGGGASGILTLNAGDTLEWECEIENLTDQPLSFDSGGLYQRAQCDMLGVAVAEEPWSCISALDVPDAGSPLGTGGATGAGGSGAGGAVGGEGAGGSPGVPSTGGASGDAGGSSVGDPRTNGDGASEDDAGCGCRVGRSASSGGGHRLIAALGALAVAVRRARRPRR